MKPLNFKNIIFDLGGVLVDIDPQKTLTSYQQVSLNGQETNFNEFISLPFFKDFETGQSDENRFFSQLADYLGTTESIDTLMEIWNRLILGIPDHRIDLIKRLKQDHQLLVLSNTNPTHINTINRDLARRGHNKIEELFDCVYYSYDLNLRKPETQIFETVMQQSSLKHEETLFVDDSMENIKSAGQLGIAGLHVTGDEVLIEFFN